jgi:hypothetical protein
MTMHDCSAVYIRENPYTRTALFAWDDHGILRAPLTQAIGIWGERSGATHPFRITRQGQRRATRGGRTGRGGGDLRMKRKAP